MQDAMYVMIENGNHFSFMHVENEATLEMLNQMENWGVVASYQQHWEEAGAAMGKDETLDELNKSEKLLTEAHARTLIEQFVAAGGQYFEEGVAVHKHLGPSNPGTDTIAFQLANYVVEEDMFGDEDEE